MDTVDTPTVYFVHMAEITQTIMPAIYRYWIAALLASDVPSTATATILIGELSAFFLSHMHTNKMAGNHIHAGWEAVLCDGPSHLATCFIASITANGGLPAPLIVAGEGINQMWNFWIMTEIAEKSQLILEHFAKSVRALFLRCDKGIVCPKKATCTRYHSPVVPSCVFDKLCHNYNCRFYHRSTGAIRICRSCEEGVLLCDHLHLPCKINNDMSSWVRICLDPDCESCDRMHLDWYGCMPTVVYMRRGNNWKKGESDNLSVAGSHTSSDCSK